MTVWQLLGRAFAVGELLAEPDVAASEVVAAAIGAPAVDAPDREREDDLAGELTDALEEEIEAVLQEVVDEIRGERRRWPPRDPPLASEQLLELPTEPAAPRRRDVWPPFTGHPVPLGGNR